MIYVLRCESDKYYIGYTKNPKKRVAAHFGATGSEWTKRYKPIEVVESIAKHDEFDEDKLTKKYMMRYGVENVRGGTYVRLELPQYQKLALQDEMRMAKGACMRCGIVGHFIALCPHAPASEPSDVAVQTIHITYVNEAIQTTNEVAMPINITIATIIATMVLIAIYLLFYMYS